LKAESEGSAWRCTQTYSVPQSLLVQEEWRKEFCWLKIDPEKGLHCGSCINSTIKRADKLSTKGYGYIGEGAERVLQPIPSRQKLVEHDGSEEHKLNFEKADPLGGKQSTSRDFVPSVSFEDELYARTARTVHILAVRQLSLNDMYHLLELQNANQNVISFDHAADTSDVQAGGLSAWLEAGARIWCAEMRARAQNPIMTALFPKGMPMGFPGDGSNDRSLLEQEAVVLRFIGSNGRPFNTFYDLAELDLSKSADGRSPDAQCIAACYAGSLDQLNKHKGFLFNSDWKQATVGYSFDGASVMLGSQNGVAAKLRALIQEACRKHRGSGGIRRSCPRSCACGSARGL
jgi:hypothetical protein